MRKKVRYNVKLFVADQLWGGSMIFTEEALRKMAEQDDSLTYDEETKSLFIDSEELNNDF